MPATSGEFVKVPILAGLIVAVGQGVAQSAGVISPDKITDILLATIAAMLVYVVRETHRHSICLFGLKDDPESSGLSGDMKNLKQWREDTRIELSELHREAEEVLREVDRTRPHRPRNRP